MVLNFEFENRYLYKSKKKYLYKSKVDQNKIVAFEMAKDNWWFQTLV